MPTVAFIESNTTGTGRILARKALDRGLTVCFLSEQPERYPFVAEWLLHPRRVDTLDWRAIHRCLRREDDLVAVFSTSEYYLEVAAEAAQALGLPGADPRAIAGCRHKWRAWQQLDSAGIAVPATYRVTCPDEARAVWDRQGPPLVVKPVSGSGSLGVRLHRDRREFEEHIATLLRVTENERGLPVEPLALVQELIEGPEVSVETLGFGEGFKTLGITAKHLGAPPHFLEVGHDFPAALPSSLAESVEATANAALRALGLTFGPMHTELRLRGDRPVIIEINPRLAGGMIPVLIDHATGADVLEAVLDLYLGQPIDFVPNRQRTASIAFLVPERAGQLQAVSLPPATPAGVEEVFVRARPGDQLVREGSFRDRIGHVIATGTDVAESRTLADSVAAQVAFEVRAASPTATPQDQGTGRIRRTLHPEAMQIVRQVPTAERRLRELGWLAAIDEAHLLMLSDAGLLPAATVKPLLGTIREMRQEGFGEIAGSVAPRGTYLLYEGALIERLGVELGGATHLGRSRNDINACLFRLRLRGLYEGVFRSLWRLRSALLRRAAETAELAMPVYSQFQPGLPGTFAAYLLGVAQALARDQQALKDLLPALDTSPMGAGAGGGSTFAIRPERTAELLGFTATCRSALDAVASRDLALRLLSVVAISGMHITRLAQDFQLWTTREHGLLSMPDELAGGSSMMPQKKNPYLLEMVKGRATRASGHWVSSIATMQGTPFSNSVEVGTEAWVGVEDGIRAYDEAARLMALIVLGAQPDAQRMRRSMDDGVVGAAAVADALVRTRQVSFRQAHREVGAAVATALEQGADANQAIAALLPAGQMPDTPLGWAHLYEHGGGPGEASTRESLRASGRELDDDTRWLHGCLQRWQNAETARREAVGRLLAEVGRLLAEDP